MGGAVTFEFDRAVALRPVGPETWQGAVAPGWDTGGVPNGGYTAAIALRALRLPDTEPVLLTVHYLSPAQPGRVDVATATLDGGRRRITRTAALHQAGRHIAEATAVLGPPPADEPPRYLDAEPPALPDPDACVHARPSPEAAVPIPPLTARVELRLRPDDAGFARGVPSGKATMAGWVRLADGRPPDRDALPLFADAFPPAVFNSRLAPGWTPSLQLTVHLRARPRPGWLRASFRTRLIAGDYLEEDGELWDADDRLVAMSRQLALVPRP
jgi:acyl-CoA thioesterase